MPLGWCQQITIMNLVGRELTSAFEFVADVLFSENYALGLGVHIFNTGGDVRYLVPDPER